ncbi:putative ABC transport system ATP-binding protein [Thermoflexibacter ruber]|uniref:Putative ABC transport system ATP-binding protein n=1 Tax=Thermoflexibacter ruber TaxID=1003 RepID=A0A1I2BRT7_9BACT|nr:ABC transporter ATP-binding protein [Thermoflexibacter ruber]SFE58578.1 putative ABC transport system ATP-binding protein [Thermoflexibacter ruber]
MKIIKTVNVEKIYTSFDVDTVALNKVNLEIEQGEFVSIMGPSGCGKSTLLNLISLMDLPTRGEVFFMEQSTSKMSDRKRAEFRRKYIGFVFQNFNLIEELSVYENIELPLVYLRMPPSERAQRVRAVMERLDVAHKQRFFPMQLSGGHQQRVAVARAIVASPLVLFADEPTGNLDSKHGQEVMEILSELNEAGTTVVMVTHSTANAEFANRIIQLFDGHIVTGKVNQYSF